MHVGAVLVFDGAEPGHEELIGQIQGRLHLVPRYRQRLAFVPLQQGRPVWVDDLHFNPEYHIRHTALPRPGTEAELKRLAGRLFSQELDRSKPLWEIWLVSGLSGDRFALISKTHHALVDGVSGVDVTTVLFDTSAEPVPTPQAEPWVPGPEPSGAQLLADALLERSTVPGEIVRGARALLRGPLRVDRGAPGGCSAVVQGAMGGWKESGRAVGAQVLTALADFAPPTIMSQAARLQARQRFFNLVVTNVPGPQFELYMLGRRLTALYPQVPLTLNVALGIAIMSYNGRLNFGLLGDFDAIPDLEQVGRDLEAAIDELALAAGVAVDGRAAKDAKAEDRAEAKGGNGRPALGIDMPRGRPGARPR